MRLLSIDWDYFIPTYPFDKELWMLYDWGMKDSPFHRDAAQWINRGAGFLMNNLPLPDTTGLEETFWGRFKFWPWTKFYYSDSHLYAALIPDPDPALDIEEVWNFDAHHDLGYTGTQKQMRDKNEVTCDNWLACYKIWGARVRVLYPRWRPDAMKEESKPVFAGLRKTDNEQPVSKPFDAVYVCRSSAWSPAWLDHKFVRFMEASPLKERINLQEDYDAMIPRECSMEVMREYVANWTKLREGYAAAMKQLKEAQEEAQP